MSLEGSLERDKEMSLVEWHSGTNRGKEIRLDESNDGGKEMNLEGNIDRDTVLSLENASVRDK
jgi:hypothetical protein